MTWLLRDNWLGSLLAFVLGAAITWFLLDRHRPAAAVSGGPAQDPAEPPAAAQAPTSHTPQPARAEPAPAEPAPAEPAPPPAAPPVAAARSEFSQLMDAEPTLFDEIQPAPPVSARDESPDVPPGRYGEGSADAVPHQGPPDGFTIKGNAQSMLFHTPDSPYYGRTKPEVWFRTEADAERAGFTKYTRRPRKATNPRD